jgi:hypothetical protein
MIGKPIYMEQLKSQMTGDIFFIIGNNKTEVDFFKVLNSLFLIQKDTLSKNGYRNQVKGQNNLENKQTLW